MLQVLGDPIFRGEDVHWEIVRCAVVLHAQDPRLAAHASTMRMATVAHCEHIAPQNAWVGINVVIVELTCERMRRYHSTGRH